MTDLVAQANRLLTPRRLARLRAAAACRLRGLTVAFDGLHDPHNVSAALRSCEAFGVQDVHLVGDSRTVPLNRGVTRGCHRWLTFHWHASARPCVRALHEGGFRVLLAMPGDRSPPLPAIDFGRSTALVFGNEHDGVCSEFRAEADGLYRIPMYGLVESLNVSVSVAVSLAYAAEARRRAVGSATDMTPDEVQALMEAWLRRELAGRRPA